MSKFLAILWLLFLWAAPLSAKDNPVVAKVGPYTLTRADFEREVEGNPQLKALITVKPEMKKILLERWVEVNLLALGGKEAGLEKDPEVRAQIEEQIRLILAQNFYRKKVLSGLKVTEGEAQQYYLKHKKDYSLPERIQARHILIRVPEKASPKEEAAARAQIEKIRRQILAGADFAKMARQYSQDPGTKEKGGDLGLFSRGQMIPEFEEAVFKLKVGELSPPIRTRFGYHLVRVEARVPAQVQPYEKVKEQVKKDLLEEKKTERLSALLSRLRKKYPVELHPENLP
ncbi:peptidylprolyl isomerase [Thermosulfurimonas marina]|nr:peptidylprolyl isomerase [Thermosulfurimonas marina]